LDRKSAVLIAFATAALGLSACAVQPSQVTLRETAWLSETGLLEALSNEPFVDREALYAAALKSELADIYTSPQALRSELLAGEFLFKAPLLLGGQAAKAGISCHSCHTNGTDNPHFLFPAVSGESGTADTTHSFFSKSLGNQVTDPIAIPDLTKGGKVAHSMESGELEAFLTTIVVGEFSGVKASPRVIAPMATYVRALRLTGSMDQTVRPRSLKQDLEDVRLTVDQAALQADDGKSEVAALLLSSGQSQIQSIHERLDRSSHSVLRDWLTARAREMGMLRRRLNAGEGLLKSDLAGLQERLSSGPDFSQAAHNSLYNPAILANALKR
jgi:hypothetical protein